MNNRMKIALSVGACMLPTVIGLCLYVSLPALLPVHFNFAGQADSWWPKFNTIVFLPGICAILNGFTLFVTLNDPKKQNIHGSGMRLLYWLIPVIINVLMGSIYMSVLGFEINIGMIVMLLLGVLFVSLGNVLPKVKQNYVFGVRTSWALNDPENWNHTSRFSSRCFIAAGIFLMGTCWFNSPALLMADGIVVFALLAVAPIVYSYRFYKKHQKTGQ